MYKHIAFLLWVALVFLPLFALGLGEKVYGKMAVVCLISGAYAMITAFTTFPYVWRASKWIVRNDKKD